MQNFTNDRIDTTQLPKFEEVPLTALHHNYWKVLLIHFMIFILILGIVMTILIFNPDTMRYRIHFAVGAAVLAAIVLLNIRIGFNKKGFAFRDHDVLFRSGIIATNTIVIPYNRIQHVALHEGLASRYFGLAAIQMFTAGASSSDIEIPGIDKQEAENIKQLLMGKIQKQL